MDKRWTHSYKSIFNIGYHLIWSPKYRRALLITDVEKRLKKLIIEKTVAMNVNIETLNIMPDHIHLIVKPEARYNEMISVLESSNIFPRYNQEQVIFLI